MSSPDSGPSTSSSTNFFDLTKLKAGLKKYGRAGIITYFGLSTCVTACFFIAIENAVDVRSLLGMKKKEEEEDPTKEASFVERIIVGKGSNLALAVICSKMLIPIKIPTALALTPYVSRVLERMLGPAALGMAAVKPH